MSIDYSLEIESAGVRGGGMRPIVWAIAVGFACIAAGCGPRGPEPLSAFDGRLQDWTRETLGDSPELATKTGASVEIVGAAYGDKLDDRSALAEEARRTGALRRIAELRALDTANLNAND